MEELQNPYPRYILGTSTSDGPYHFGTLIDMTYGPGQPDGYIRNPQHDDYIDGWFAGYVAFIYIMLVILVLSVADAVEGVYSLVTSATSATDAAASAVAAESLVDEGVYIWDCPPEYLEDVPSLTEKAEVESVVNNLNPSALSASESNAPQTGTEINDLLEEGWTPGDAENAYDMYGSTFDKIWSLQDLQGVEPEQMELLKANLGRGCYDGKLSTSKAEGIVDNLENLNGVDGLPDVVQTLITANKDSNFNGVAFQLERASTLKDDPGNTIELEVIKDQSGYTGRIDIKVTNSDGVTYIEDKSAMGDMKYSTMKSYIYDTEKKYYETQSDTVGGTKKLEVDARNGLGTYDKDSIKTMVNDVIDDYLHPTNRYGVPFKIDPTIPFEQKNYIDEIEIFLPDGSSIIGRNTGSDYFIWS